MEDTTKTAWVLMDDDGYAPPKISVFSTEEKAAIVFEKILREIWDGIAARHPDTPREKLVDDNDEYFDECLEGLAVLSGTMLVKVYEAPVDKLTDDYNR